MTLPVSVTGKNGSFPRDSVPGAAAIHEVQVIGGAGRWRARRVRW